MGEKSFADYLADREATRASSKSILECKWKTSKVQSLKIVNRAQGCNGEHCVEAEGYCREEACVKRLNQELTDSTSTNETTNADIQDQLQRIDDLLWDISVYCRTDNLNYPTTEESRFALESALRGKTEASLCDCVACKLAFQQKEAKMLKQKVSVAKARVAILREYRSTNDKEALEKTSSNYMKGGKYFTPVGKAKAKGVKALRPTLQMQSSYDVVTRQPFYGREIAGQSNEEEKQEESVGW